MERGARSDAEVIGVGWLGASLSLKVSGGSDHGSIITSELGTGEENWELKSGEGWTGFGAEDLIGADAASEDNTLSLRMSTKGELKFLEEDVTSGGLEGGGEVSYLLVGNVTFEFIGGSSDGKPTGLLDGAEDGSFEAGE